MHIPNQYNGVSEIQIDPRGDKLHFYNELLLQLVILVLEINISRTILYNYRNFPGFSRTYAFSRALQAWKSQHYNSRTLQGLYEPWIIAIPSNQFVPAKHNLLEPLKRAILR